MSKGRRYSRGVVVRTVNVSALSARLKAEATSARSTAAVYAEDTPAASRELKALAAALDQLRLELTAGSFDVRAEPAKELFTFSEDEQP